MSTGATLAPTTGFDALVMGVPLVAMLGNWTGARFTSLMLTEVANALWRLQRAGQLEGAGLQQRFERAVALVDHIEPDRNLQAEALALATHLDHPVVDCLYLVLARREVAALLSADQRLLKLAARVLP